MDVSTEYFHMYNIGTDKQIPRGQKYLMGIRLNWYQGNPEVSNYRNISLHSLSNIKF